MFSALWSLEHRVQTENNSTLYNVLSRSITFMCPQSIASNTKDASSWLIQKQISHVSRVKKDSQQTVTLEPEERFRTNIWAGCVDCHYATNYLLLFLHTILHFWGEKLKQMQNSLASKPHHKQIRNYNASKYCYSRLAVLWVSAAQNHLIQEIDLFSYWFHSVGLLI